MNHPDADNLTRTLHGPRTLLELCLDLRMAHNGSADPISPEETAAAIAYLRYRLATWTPSTPSSARFDAAVRELVEATIAEVEQRQDARILDRTLIAKGTDADRLRAVHERAVGLTGDAYARTMARISCSYSSERTAIARGARVDGDEMVWPDGERYPRRTEPSPLLCDHANEGPRGVLCACPEGCYCRQHTCRAVTLTITTPEDWKEPLP